MKTSFMIVTLERIRDFNDGLEILKVELEKHGLGLADVRNHLLTAAPLPTAELEKDVKRLQKIRQEAIEGEMFYIFGYAEEEGIELPAEYRKGEALDPIMQPELYEIFPNFAVFGFVSWYEPEELEGFEPKKII